MSQSFSNQRKVNKTRKPHRCTGCRKRFPAGSWLWYQSGVWDGEFYSGYMCQPCYQEMRRGDYSDGFSEGDLKEGRIERAREYRQERNRSTLWTRRRKDVRR